MTLRDMCVRWPRNIVPRRRLEPRWVYGLRYRWWLTPWKAELKVRIAASWEDR